MFFERWYKAQEKVGKSISVSFVDVLHQQGVTWIAWVVSTITVKFVCDENIFPVTA
jgi:hypothetical protein